MDLFRKQLSNYTDLWLYCLLWILGTGLLVLLVPKGTMHLAINQFHHPVADIFFKYITHLGDGVVPFIVAFILIFFSYKYALLISGSAAIADLIAQILKRKVFPDMERPIIYLKDYSLNLVDGVYMYVKYSFPSGHSASIFALCIGLALMSSSKLIRLIFFLVAMLVGFSRIYLSQHFLTDMFGGSVIGVFSICLTAYLISMLKGTWLQSSLTVSLKRRKV